MPLPLSSLYECAEGEVSKNACQNQNESDHIVCSYSLFVANSNPVVWGQIRQRCPEVLTRDVTSSATKRIVRKVLWPWLPYSTLEVVAPGAEGCGL